MTVWTLLQWLFHRWTVRCILFWVFFVCVCENSVCLITLANEWKMGGREWVREGRTDGGQVVGTDTSAQGTHKHIYTNVLCNAACTWNTSSIYDCSIFVSPGPLYVQKCVCEYKTQLVSGNLCTDKHSKASVPCGKPTTCWSVKGETPKDRESWKTLDESFLFIANQGNKFNIIP